MPFKNRSRAKIDIEKKQTARFVAFWNRWSLTKGSKRVRLQDHEIRGADAAFGRLDVGRDVYKRR